MWIKFFSDLYDEVSGLFVSIVMWIDIFQFKI